MDKRTTIDKVRDLFRKSDAGPVYEPIYTNGSDHSRGNSDESDDNVTWVRRPVITVPDEEDVAQFSWFEYSIFLLLGVAMLWAW